MKLSLVDRTNNYYFKNNVFQWDGHPIAGADSESIEIVCVKIVQ